MNLAFLMQERFKLCSRLSTLDEPPCYGPSAALSEPDRSSDVLPRSMLGMQDKIVARARTSHSIHMLLRNPHMMARAFGGCEINDKKYNQVSVVHVSAHVLVLSSCY